MTTEVVYKLPSGAPAEVLGRRGQALDQLLLAGLDVPRTMAVPIHIIDRLRGPAATHAAGLPPEVQAAITTFVDEVGPVIVRTSGVDDAQAPIESEALRDVQSVLAVMADIRAQHPDQRLAMLIQRVVVGECRGVCALTDDDGVAIDVWHRAEEAQEGGGPARNGRGFAQRSTPERTECSRAIVRAAGIDWPQRNGDTLDDDKAAAIAIAARAAADALFEHGPLQLVWTIGGGRVWLIDAVARPRVRLEPGARAEGPRVIWTDVDTQELWPDVATPMTREVAHAWVRALAMPFLADTAPVRDFIDVVDGRIYANVNAVVGFFHSLPVLRRQTPAKLGSFIFATGSSLGPQAALVKEDLGPPRFSPWIAFTAAWRMARLLWRARRLDGTEVIEACARIHNDNDGLATVELTTLDNPELVEHLDRLIIAPFGSEPDATVAGRALGVGLLCARALPHLTRSWLADEDQSLALRLLSGLPATETAEAAIALKRLATLAVGLAVIELINPDRCV